MWRRWRFASGELEKAAAQDIELGNAPAGAFGRGGAQGVQQPLGGGVEDEAELVGVGAVAGGAVGGEWREPFPAAFDDPPYPVKYLNLRYQVPVPNVGNDEALMDILDRVEKMGTAMFPVLDAYFDSHK